MIEREDRGEGVALIRMRHGKANALDAEFCGAIADAFASAQSSGARAVVLTGTGSIFSAGIDLKRLLAEPPSYAGVLLTALDRALLAVWDCTLPVVAAVNGHAIAGGCVLACACDLRLLAHGPAKLGVPELRVGVPLPVIAVEILRASLAPQEFQETLYVAATYAGEEALKRGLADIIVGEADLLAVAGAEASRLGALPPDVFRATKDAVRAPVRAHLAAHKDRLDAAIRALWRSPATLEAVRRYVDSTLR